MTVLDCLAEKHHDKRIPSILCPKQKARGGFPVWSLEGGCEIQTKRLIRGMHSHLR